MSRPSLADKDFLTVIETAEYFGLSRRKLIRLAEEKNPPFMAMYGTRKLIIKDEFIKYLKKPGVKEGLVWQAKDKEETRSIEFYTQENPSEPMESISTSTW